MKTIIIDSVEYNLTPKIMFKNGTWLVENVPNNYARFIQILEVVDVQGKERYRISRDLHNDEDVVECRFVENNYHPFNIQDANAGDVLCYKDEISIYKHDIKNCTKQETTFGGFVYHCCYDGKEFIIDSLYSLTEQDKMDIHPATKEEQVLLFTRMKEAGYEWDAEKKELKKIEQKTTWSEEDEERIEFLIAMCDDEQAECVNNSTMYRECTETKYWLKSLKGRVQPKQEWGEYDKIQLSEAIQMIEANGTWIRSEDAVKKVSNWLKSIKPNHWKPSEEQMTSLKNAAKHFGGPDYDDWDTNLESLYNDLKKL